MNVVFEILPSILMNILAPLLVLVGIGALAQWRFKLDLATLSKLNIYVFVPAFVFNHVAGSQLTWAHMGGIALACLLQGLLLGVVVLVIGKVMRLGQKTFAAILLGVLFYNSGNYGLPLAELAYPGKGAAAQTFVLLTQNVLTFTVGLAIAAWAGSGDMTRGILRILRMPVLPVLVAALVARWYCDGDRELLPTIIRLPTSFLSSALVPVALLTLGAQLATNPRWPRWKPVGTVLVLRLFYAPLQMAGLLYALHLVGWRPTQLWPWPSEVLIVTAGTPCAINMLLLTMECDGDSELAADCVFWTTILSVLTITLWLVCVRLFFA